MKQDPPWLTGLILLATPKMEDPNFEHAAVLIGRHDQDGALGLVLNHPTPLTLRQAWSQISLQPCRHPSLIYQGGPCTGPLMVLHTHPDVSEEQILPGLYFSSYEKAKVEWLIEHGREPIRFFVGYSGWESGQLESELLDQSWLLAPTSAQEVLEETGDLWDRHMERIWQAAGLPYLKPRLIPKDPSTN